MTKEERQVPDEELIRQVLAGNQEAFRKLYLKYYTPVRQVCSRAIKNDAMVEDLVQDVFVAVFRGIPNFRCCNFPAWVRTIAFNLVRNKLKQMEKNGKNRSSLADLEDAQASNAPDPAKNSEDRELKRFLSDALDELPELTRKCVVSFYAGYSYTEIAKMYHLTVGQVESHLRKGRRFLRNKFMRLH